MKKRMRTGLLAVLACLLILTGTGVSAQSAFLKTNGKLIRDNYGNGNVVALRGTNLGGWFVQEPWMNNTGNGVDEYTFRNALSSRLGETNMWNLINAYRDQYVKTSDFDAMKNAGMNCIRIPINFMDFMDFSGNMRTSIPGQSSIWARLDWAITEMGNRGIYTIIDLHAAQGSQNGFDNSGQAGPARFWYQNSEGETYRANMVRLWQAIATHYRGNPAVAGYDLLNEPMGTSGSDGNVTAKNTWHNQCYQAIRAIDPDHIIIIESPWNLDTNNICYPSQYRWTNVVYQIHCYEWNNQDWNGMNNYVNNTINHMKTWANNYNVPILNGEFQVYGFMDLWGNYLNLMNSNNINWTSWTYKVTGNGSSWGTLYNSFSGSSPDIYNNSYDQILAAWRTCDTATHYRYNGTLGPVVAARTNVNKGASLFGSTATPTPTPGSTTTYPVPGKIEAENYSAMSGIQTETCSEGTLNVGWIEAGDWLDYRVNIAGSGTYRVDYRVAAQSSSIQLQLRQGNTVLGSVTASSTGGWQNWTTASHNVSLNAGTTTLRVYAAGTGWNINYLVFTSVGVTATPSPTQPSSNTPTPTPPVSSNTISLRASANGLYVCADNAGASALIANRSAAGGWEQFQLVNNADGTVSLRALANNMYVCADNAGASALIANRTAIGGWEKFTLINNSDGTVSLRASANSMYVCADNAGASALIANRTAIGGWEKFTVTYY
ncbi:MAG: cellulase family glycosylhydrolase [Spirochaetales bacterium]|nr:cellulase family glycosylhydrolase [Spirochaetales bacterium]